MRFLYISTALLQAAVLIRREPVLLLEGTVKSGVIAKACQLCDLRQRHILAHVLLRCCQTLLGHIAVKADTQTFFAKIVPNRSVLTVQDVCYPSHCLPIAVSKWNATVWVLK